MKVIVLNTSPRKAWNTAKLLKSAAEGAKSTGAEVEYIDLYDLNFTGDDYSNYFKGKINVGFFVSMNATQTFYDQLYKDQFEAYAKELEMFNGKVCLYPCYDTLQVSDYAKFSMGSFDERKKKAAHEEHFPKDLENAFRIGQALS